MNHDEVLELPFLLGKRHSAVSVTDGHKGNSSGSSGADFLDFKSTHITYQSYDRTDWRHDNDMISARDARLVPRQSLVTLASQLSPIPADNWLVGVIQGGKEDCSEPGRSAGRQLLSI